MAPTSTSSPTRSSATRIGDRTAGLKKKSDGGLTIYLQSESPGGEEKANSLPSPSDGEWFVILRMYRRGPR